MLLEKDKPICVPLRYNILREIDRGSNHCNFNFAAFKVTCKRKGASVDYPVIGIVFAQFQYINSVRIDIHLGVPRGKQVCEYLAIGQAPDPRGPDLSIA